MPELKKTTAYGKGKASHYHTVYLRDRDGASSTEREHSHPVMWQEDIQLVSVPDTMTGIVTESFKPTGTGNFFLQPSADGHTHEIIDLTPSEEKKKKESDESITSEVLDLFRFVKEYESDSRKKSEESERFRKGEQWESAIKEQLRAENRAALSFNDLDAALDVLCGYQRQNRTDFKAFPIEDGDSRAADILNVVVKSIELQNEYPFTESQVFDSVVGTGRGFFQVWKDYERDLNGEIRIGRFPWRDIWMGPHEELDGSDCEYIFKGKWYSLASLKAEYPDKADKIAEEYNLFEDHLNENHVQHETGQYERSTNRVTTADPDLVDIARKNFRVLELWRKQYKKIPIITQVEDDFYFNAEGMGNKDISSFKTIPGIKVIEKKKVSMRVTKTASEVLLEDVFSDEEDFDIFPCYAKKSGKDWWGKVEPAKDAVREQNKRLSQISDILNKVAIYGRYYDDETFPSPSDAEKFRDDSTKQGFLTKINNVDKPPKVEEGIKFPNELATYSEMMNSKRREILNINAELLGISSKAESGIAQVEKKKQALIGNEFLFDNLRFTKKRVFKRVVKLIQEIYPPDRILRIVENQNNMKPVRVGKQSLFPDVVQMGLGGGMNNPMSDPNQVEMMQQKAMAQRRQEILEILKNTDLTRFDISIDESPESPTTKHSNFMIWSDMAGKGYPIPPTLLYELSDLPEKDKVIEQVNTMQQQQADMENRKMETEIKKTIIAKSQPQGAGMV